MLTVFEDGPAAKAGLKRGDVITEVDGTALKGKTSEQATALIKGRAGTTVKLAILSDGKRREITAKRAEVSVPVVEARMEKCKGRDVRLRRAVAVHLRRPRRGVGARSGRCSRRAPTASSSTCATTAAGCCRRACSSPRCSSRTGRSCPRGAAAAPDETFKASGQAIDTDVPVVVLVNDGTASASEIVTGALQDRDRATVVGTRTFGKGVFQEIEPISNGGALDITVGEYYTPKGRNLGPRNGQAGGITPTCEARTTRTPRRSTRRCARPCRALAGKTA